MTAESQAEEIDVHQVVMDMILGYWVSHTIRAIADLSIADHLASGGLTADEIADREGAAVETTFRLLRAGVGLGLITVGADGRFHSTDGLATLRQDATRSLRSIALSFTDPEVLQSWNGFVTSVRNGDRQADGAAEPQFYANLAQNPEAGERFSAAMASATSCWSHNIAEVIDTTYVHRAVDVGGANGTLVRLLQQANPALHAVVFDEPAVIDWAQSDIARSGFPDRTEVVGGDFFKSVPPGDLYLLKFILHNWNDQQCIEILRHCRRAALPGARIAIIEFIVGDLANPGRMAALDDLAMLAVLGGRSRSLDEFDGLLTAAGLRRIAVRPTTYPQSVIEAVVD
jgi:O-methyltransferase domain/Dimerisation domain